MPPNLSATFENTAIRHSAQSEESQLPKRDSSPLKYRRVQNDGGILGVSSDLNRGRDSFFNIFENVVMSY